MRKKTSSAFKKKMRLIGAENKIKGQRGENYFVNCCRAERLCFFKIADGGKPCKGHPKGFIRYSQVCDFIVNINGNFWLLDTKMKKTIIRSLFFPKIGTPRNKMSSTQRQAADFVKAYHHGNARCGFLFKKTEYDPFFSFIPAKMLFKIKKKEITTIIPITVRRISDISEELILS